MRVFVPVLLSACCLLTGWGQTGPQQSGAQVPSLEISHAGARTVVDGSPLNFIGAVRQERVFAAVAPSRAAGGSVTFTPGSRTRWHSHPLGQILVITAGVGRVQIEGGPVQEVRAGDVVRIPPNKRHWHGAAPDSAMTHLAITESEDGNMTTWMEPVTDAQYLAHAQ